MKNIILLVFILCCTSSFARDLWNAPLDQGLELYQDTMNILYKKSSRLRICLKCGEIDSIQNLNETNHKCALNFNRFPVLVTTSWIKMDEFFTSGQYVNALRGKGIEPSIERVVEVEEPPSEVSKVAALAKPKSDYTD